MTTINTISNLGYSVEREIRRYYRQNATDPPICATLRRSNSTPISLADVSTISFSMRTYGNIYASKKINDIACSITNSTLSQVCYYWKPGDLDTVGAYSGQFTVHYNSTVGISTSGGYAWTWKKEVFPTNVELLVLVVESMI